MNFLKASLGIMNCDSGFSSILFDNSRYTEKDSLGHTVKWMNARDKYSAEYALEYGCEKDLLKTRLL